jgi:putative spermidine/putrescine transport system substrate-binding protein
VYYWATPETTCLDGRTDVKCKGFDDWIKAWTEIRS